ncbi:MAG: hypothetical protein ABR520_00375 [Mycobacteriales bacterium]|nr:hypothetical protein [Frankia sp.]
MSREHYVSPVVRGREPSDPRLAVWRFRVVSAVILVLAVLTVVAVINHINGAAREDPSFLTPTSPAPAPAASLGG